MSLSKMQDHSHPSFKTCSAFITKIHRVAFMNFAHVNFKNSNHFEFFGTFFTRSFMIAICVFWCFVEKIGIFQRFQTIFFRWYLSSLFCLVLFFMLYKKLSIFKFFLKRAIFFQKSQTLNNYHVRSLIHLSLVAQNISFFYLKKGNLLLVYGMR